MSAESLIQKARWQMIMDDPFFGTLALKLKLVLDKTGDICKTAATNGKKLFYYAPFIEKLSPLERKGVVAHETMHPALNHHTRRGHRDPELWNIACDLAINPIIKKSGYILPNPHLDDPEFHDMPAEEIYNKLVTEKKYGRKDVQKWGRVLDADQYEPNPQSEAAEEAEWQIHVGQALEIAKQAGKMPGHIEKAFAEILKPMVPWTSLLWPFCNSIRNDDYSWSKPHRAYISEDEYFPSLRDESTGHIAFIADSSGSCDAYYQQFISECAAIHTDIKPEKITLLHCDTRVCYEKELSPEDEFPMDDMQGGGGTRFAPAFEWLEENAPDVDVAVYLTDLESHDFGEAPHFPVLWVSTTNRDAPFGTVSRILLDH